MSAEELIGEAERLGVHLWLEGDKLRFRAPSGALSDDLVDRMRRERRELIRALGTSPLTMAQYALWLHQQWDRETSAYNIGFAVEVREALDEDVLRRALDSLVQRHGTLGSVLVEGRTGPMTVARNQRAELRSRSVAAHQLTSLEFLESALEEPFDLARDVLLRGYCFDGGGRRWFLLVVHHFAADAESFWQLLAELDQLLCGQTLPPLKGAPYSAAARHEVRFLASPQREALLAKYRVELAEYCTLLPLPNDFAYPKAYRVRGASHVVSLGDRATCIRELARRLRATPYAVLMAVFGVLLHRLTGQHKILVGAPMLGRDDAAYADTVGHFVNVLPIRINLADGPGFDELVTEVRQELLSRMPDRRLPFSVLAAELDIERHPGRGALLQVVFGWQNPPLGKLVGGEDDWTPFGGTVARAVRVPQQQGAFELIVDASETPSGMELTFKYNTTIFKQESVRRYAACFERILDAALANPEASINELPWTTADQVALVTQQFVGKALPLPDHSVLAPIERCFTEHADREAVSAGENRINYRQLRQLSGGVAAALGEAGVGRGAVVAVILEPGLDMIVAALGIMRAGAAYLPIDSSHPDPRIAHYLSDSGAKVVICSRQFPPERRTWGSSLGVLYCEDIVAADVATIAVGPDDAAYIIYTSGSSGKPKGVLVEHRALANLCVWHCDEFAVTCEDRAIKYAGWGFDASVWEIFPYLSAGASLHVVPADCRLDVARLAGFLRERRATIAFLPTPICERFLREDNDGLRVLLTGGDTLRSAEHRGRYTLVNNYGPTESTVVATSGPAVLRETAIPIGRPIANTQVFILTPDGTICPVGVFGELCVAGAGLARGYVGNPSETAQRFRTDLIPGARAYLTGDRARWLASGELEFQGRIDQQVKIRGVRVELGEVEHVLSAFPGVAKAVAVLLGDGSEQLVGYYESEPSCDARGLMRHAKEHLPAAAVPAHLVRLDRLPVTLNGKVDLRALPAPTPAEEGDDDEGYSDFEAQLVALWKAHLHVPRVRRSDGFFELGGNSLSAAKLAVDVGCHFGAELPVKALVDTPSFESFCGIVRDVLNGKELRERAASVDELWKDSHLADTLSPERPGEFGPRSNIIVTGATGFVGSFLLAQVLQDPSLTATCLVRALGDEEARDRLRTTFRAYGIDESQLGRVRAIAADFTKPRLGLDPTSYQQLASGHGQIFHCGAWVNFTYPYHILRDANVVGTLRMLELACSGPSKTLHVISAGSVAEAAAGGFGIPVREDDPLTAPEQLTMGYSQSKWVSERLAQSVFSRGLRGAIYRLGLIWGDVRTGVCNLDDMALRCVLTSLELGSVPRWQHDLHFTTVDFSVRAVAALATRFDGGEVFHLTPPRPLSDDEQFELLRVLRPALKQESYPTWRARVLRAIDDDPEHPLAGVRHYFSAELSNKPLRFDNARAATFLDGLGISHPPLTASALRRYATYFMQNGLFRKLFAADESISIRSDQCSN